MTTVALEAPTTTASINQLVFLPIVAKTPVPARIRATRPETTVQAPAQLADQALISAMCNREEWALELLYDRYHRYAYSLAYRVVQDANIAEDIVQEAFLAIWRKAGSYEAQQGNVRSWLQAIVHHRAIDKVREARHRSQQWVPLQTENEQDPPGEQPDVWEEAWQDEQHRIIRTVLDQIPPEQRQVIELAYFGGYTHAEIAEQWNIPLGTVKGRMRLGLQKMKCLLQEYGLETEK
ncbi:MAG TPA: sigma-70 family RNA polymerase sigma factor [Ktedonobacteraceae bacterium]|nr:sigma-70 family RNA polymerase sigma factor [Ktedonobacteraceae bacterium]